MVGAVEWGNLQVAGAFILGAVFATIVTLRVVRSVTNFFAGIDRHRLRRHHDDDRTTDDG